MMRTVQHWLMTLQRPSLQAMTIAAADMVAEYPFSAV
jgi:hypothetical protein